MRGLFSHSVMVLALSLAAAPGVWSQVRPDTAVSRDAARADASQDTAAKLREAASQHAIIGIYLDEGRYEAVPGEFKRILDLDLSGENEKLVVQAAWQIVEKLREARRYSLAHEVVDMTLARAGDVENRFSLLMLRGKIFQDQKLYRQAIEAVREAQGLKPR